MTNLIRMGARRPLLACLALLAPAWVGAAVPAYNGPLYNQVRAKSSHNSYEHKESVVDQIVYHRIRSLELDLHNAGPDGDFAVYHTSLLPTPYNQCFSLSGCLANIKAAADLNPDHEVITIFMDLKQSFETGHNAATLDKVLNDTLGSDLMTPAKLRSACSTSDSGLTLQESVGREGTAYDSRCRWPSLEELQGKFFVVLTDNSEQYVRNSSGTVSNTVANSRKAFVHGDWNESTERRQGFRVFFNQKLAGPINKQIRDANLVSRSYNLNSSDLFADGKKYEAHHLGTNLINYHQDTWSKTHNARLWPFECLPGVTCSSAAEAYESGITILVNSKDIDGGTDSGFVFREFGTATSETDWIRWRANIVDANSYVGDMTKGCLMARADATSARAPYFAVCKTGESNWPRIQYRTANGSGFKTYDYDNDEKGVRAKAMTFFQLRCIRIAGTSKMVCEGYVSPDNYKFYQIGPSVTFDMLLSRQGIAASSHGQGKRKFYFDSLRRLLPGGSWTRFDDNNDATKEHEIGTVYDYQIVNGLGTF